MKRRLSSDYSTMMIDSILLTKNVDETMFPKLAAMTKNDNV